MFDPLELSEKTRKTVCKGGKRKFYRFRTARFYGGIATADCVGCNLRCVFCWAHRVITDPANRGDLYSPGEVAERLISKADKAGYDKLRVSGNEPTLCKDLLLELLDKIPERYLFILETNGILIGHDEEYAGELAEYGNLHVRVSLKGSSPEEFAKLTGAKEDFFRLQLRALELLNKADISFHPAVILPGDPGALRKELAGIDPGLPAELEVESLRVYPHLRKRLEGMGIGF